MKHQKTWFVVSLIIIAAMVLTACQPAAPAETISHHSKLSKKKVKQVIVEVTAEPQETMAEMSRLSSISAAEPQAIFLP